MTNSKAYGLLINYHYCTNCHSCEISCQMEHDLPVDKWGIKVQHIGPWQLSEDKWQYDYVPVPTDLCDLCAERTSKGKKPLCVKHCQSLVMEYGPVDELYSRVDGKTPFCVFVPKSGCVDADPTTISYEFPEIEKRIEAPKPAAPVAAVSVPPTRRNLPPARRF